MATPRATSPAASERGLPTSLMTRPVTSAARAASASAAAYSAAALAGAGVSAQPRAAAAARPTAAATSASLAGCHSPRTSAGSCGLRLVIVMAPPADRSSASPCHEGLVRQRPAGDHRVPDIPAPGGWPDPEDGHMNVPDLGWEVVVASGAELGERPFWDAGQGSLMWVDINAGHLHRHRPGAGDEIVLKTSGA